MDGRPLRGVLADIADIVGEEAALRVAQAGGGIPRYIPTPDRVGRAGHWLVAAVGLDAARAIARILGGGPVLLPMGPTGTQAQIRREIDHALQAGHSCAEVARSVGVHIRTVERRRSRLAGSVDDRQGRLF